MLNTYIYLTYYVHVLYSLYITFIIYIYFMYLTYYVRLVGIKEVTDCRNARCGNIQNNEYFC